jgi:zinc protease
MLMIDGKFDEAKALELVKQYFGPIPKPARELHKLYTAERLTNRLPI